MVTQRPCHMADVAWVWPWGGRGRNPRTRTEQAGYCDHSQGWPAPPTAHRLLLSVQCAWSPATPTGFPVVCVHPSVRVADWVVSTGTVWPTNPKQYLTLCRRGLQPWTGGRGRPEPPTTPRRPLLGVDLGGPGRTLRAGEAGWWMAGQASGGDRSATAPRDQSRTSELRLPCTAPQPRLHPSHTLPRPLLGGGGAPTADLHPA